jgi:hypothetical protein
VKSLQQYCEWMKGLLGFIPDGRYELVSFATDEKRRNVSAYAVFHGTHTGQGGPNPCPSCSQPLGRSPVLPCNPPPKEALLVIAPIYS